MGKMLNILFPCYFLILCFILFHPYTLLLFFCAFNLPPQFPIPLIPLQVSVPGGAEGEIRRALGIALPVPAFLYFSDAWSALVNNIGNVLSAVPSGSHTQGNHGIHTRKVFNAQVLLNIGKVCVVGGCPAAGWRCALLRQRS